MSPKTAERARKQDERLKAKNYNDTLYKYHTRLNGFTPASRYVGSFDSSGVTKSRLRPGRNPMSGKSGIPV